MRRGGDIVVDAAADAARKETKGKLEKFSLFGSSSSSISAARRRRRRSSLASSAAGGGRRANVCEDYHFAPCACHGLACFGAVFSTSGERFGSAAIKSNDKLGSLFCRRLRCPLFPVARPRSSRSNRPSFLAADLSATLMQQGN